MISRLADCRHSFFALPAWVRIWVAAVLIPANALPFFFLDTAAGRAGAIASVFVVLTNIPIMLIERGMSRLMSVPHLIAWLPLLPYLAARLVFEQHLNTDEVFLVVCLFLANGISLVFDIIDSWRWLCGQRDIPGRTSKKGTT